MPQPIPFNYEQNLGDNYCRNLPTLGQAMAQIIRWFGGRRLYGVGGDFAANLIKALGNELELCAASNEMHAGFSACAQAELEGMGFCLTTYMVGSLPCLSAAALAMAERLPVVFISGAPGEAEVSGNSAIHHMVHSGNAWRMQYDNALEAFAAMGMRVTRLQGQRSAGQPNMAAEQFFQLLTHAWMHKQPVFIEVPRDQVFMLTQALKLPASLTQLPLPMQILDGSQVIAAEILKRLHQARQPLLFIGDGVKHNPKLKDLLMQFARRCQIPFATSWLAKGLFDEFDPLCLGAYNGVFSDNPSRDYVEGHMDYVLDVASSIYAQDTNMAFSTGSHFIESFANKTVLKSTVALELDLVELFTLLLDLPLPSFCAPAVEYALQPTKAADKLDFHNLASVLNQLQAAQSRPCLYLPEVGNSYFASYALRTRLGRSGRGWLTNPWYGAMGTALPYARQAAKLIKEQHFEDRLVVIIGDGGMHFQSNELIHIQKDQTDVTILYMRNNIFHLGKSGNEPIYHCNDPAFDVHHLIAAYGGKSCLVQSVGEFAAAFEQYGHEAGLRLIEIPCLAQEQYQCREIRLLNLYIQAKNGSAQASAQWQALCDGSD
ncbi:thiamine pyrophosphate-dependent enzyme [Aliiglaciecola sp. CAU 1673]|uniref:thiamine pyrophosphate-dependent enzyme n=1 Tax=Aliiglaciecola sp. CAU 1673 TaxID=3032595 RepID=UPI0023DB79F9|nr:thiamine pyrophosphate-dependent enzyme [Aliiglaciecola sp. CAU 1673]MDF2177422.1 thiamine pyrophosphate-dependent enzyme [Aliiglaciecola sp. CAU 1673]